MNSYISIDIETTGLNPETCQVLEFAAIIDNLEGNVSELPCFHRIIQYNKIIGEPYALSLNKRILDILAEANSYISKYSVYLDSDICYPDELAYQFKKWLVDHGQSKITIAGKNFAVFDLAFLKKLKDWESIPYRHRILDPGHLYWNYLEDGFILPSLDKCLERADINRTVQHTAISDAEDVCLLIRKHVNGN